MATSSMRRLVGSGLVLATISGFVLVALQMNRSTIGDEQAAASLPAAAITLPSHHEHYLERLSVKREVHYKNVPYTEVLVDFSESLGVPLKLHSKVTSGGGLNEQVTLNAHEPISHRAAIGLFMRAIHKHNYLMIFEEDAIVLTVAGGFDSAMKSYNLSGMSDYTTATRTLLIAQLALDVAPESWPAADAWMRPGASVFEIDVYQSYAAHRQIHIYLNNPAHTSHAIFAMDPDVQKLMNLRFPKKGDATEKPDTTPIVKKLRQRYPYRSLQRRLAYEGERRHSTTAAPISAAARKRLQQRDTVLTDKPGSMVWKTVRAESLRLLHAEEATKFASRDGFGFLRMPSAGPGGLPQADPPRYEFASADIVRTVDDELVELPATWQAAKKLTIRLPSLDHLADYHHAGEAAFLSIPSMGHFKSKDAVAGFSAHAFMRMPKPHQFERRPVYNPHTEQWAVHRLELVSLLKHEKPAVYLSDQLPRMDELDDAKTRTLHRFEKSALKKLQVGEDVVARSTLNRIEMLGSLRASKQCMQCHNVKFGELLGAFSYVLLRDPQIDASQGPKAELAVTEAE